MRTLGGAVVVITGGATGIGLALGREAARRGARLMLVDVDDGSQAAAELEALGAEVDHMVADVTDIGQVRAAVDRTLARFGSVNVVCSNAGHGEMGRLQDTDPSVAAAMIDLNVKGCFNVIHAFAPALIKAAAAGEPAYLLNTGSEHSLGVPPYVPPLSVYTATKYAVLGLTMTAHRDLGPDGVGVSMLAPGWTRTENVQGLIDSGPEVANLITPYVQESEDVAALVFDGLLSGTRVIATNPHSREFALSHARELVADVERLPVPEDAPGN
jgi:NAD(P)-dependent dehydrogenase (short-subunit alcohol dehydrogenase family)